MKQNSGKSLLVQLASRCAKELNERQRQNLPEELKTMVDERYTKLQEKKMM